jgi:hypothetical protein
LNDYLLDTNVISESRKPKVHPRVAAWAAVQAWGRLFISRIVVVEIRFGIELLPPSSQRRDELTAWLENDLPDLFRNRILDLDEAVLLTWRRLVEEGRKRNRTFAEPDLLMAATARTHRLTMVTRNVKDFAVAGVPVLNPWNLPA